MSWLVLGVAVGAVTPIQTAINTRLRMALGTPFRASLVSFTVGLLTMLAASLALGPRPLVPSEAWGGPWWMWLAGLFGVIFMTGNVLLLPRLGSLQTVMMPVLGQILMGLLIDEFGWFGGVRHPMTPMRAAGSALALAGFVLAIVVADLLRGGRLHRRPHDAPARGARPGAEHPGTARSAGARPDAASRPGVTHPEAASPRTVARTAAAPLTAPSRRGPAATPATWLWRGVGVLCGMSSAVQTSMLGRLGTALGSPVKASFVSFLVGFAALLAIVMVRDRGLGLRGSLGGGNPWWMWIGGFLGATVVLTNSALSPLLGTGLTVLVALLGQVVGGLLIDTFGWFAVPRRRVGVVRIAGIAVAVAGIAMIRLG